MKKLYWSKDLEKLTEKEFAKAQYEPTSLRAKEKLIWSILQMNNVNFESKDFNNYPGLYKNALIHLMNKTAKLRDDYGVKKN